MNSQSEFASLNLSILNFSSGRDLIENLYLKSLIECYSRVEKTVNIENYIRDRFVKDLLRVDTPLKNWLDLKIIRVHWESWVLTDDDDLGRIDLVFESLGSDFIVECKRLKYADKKYFDEGLQRFIDLKYAKGEDYAAMIGFVVSGSPSKICDSLEKLSAMYNSTGSDFLESPFTLWHPNFKSAHARNDSTTIRIYNLLFDFSEQPI